MSRGPLCPGAQRDFSLTTLLGEDPRAGYDPPSCTWQPAVMSPWKVKDSLCPGQVLFTHLFPPHGAIAGVQRVERAKSLHSVLCLCPSPTHPLCLQHCVPEGSLRLQKGHLELRFEGWVGVFQRRNYEGWSGQREQHDSNNSVLLEHKVGGGEEHDVNGEVSKDHMGHRIFYQMIGAIEEPRQQGTRHQWGLYNGPSSCMRSLD